MRLGFEPRLGGAHDDHELIDIGNQHVLPPAAGAADHAVAQLDALDDSVAFAFGAKPDDVAGRDDVPLVGRQRFQQPPDRALKDDAVFFIANDAQQALHAQDATQTAIVRSTSGSTVCAGFVFDNLAAGQGSLARDVAFAADTLAVRRIARVIRPGQLAAECSCRGARPAVLAKVGSKLAFFAATKARRLGIGVTDDRRSMAAHRISTDSTLELDVPYSGSSGSLI